MTQFAPIPAANPLRPGEVVRLADPKGGLHFIEYVNGSGAMAVPLTSKLATIASPVSGRTQTVRYHDDGRMISSNAWVERVGTLENLDPTSEEYARCAKLLIKVHTMEAKANQSSKPRKPGKPVRIASFTDAAEFNNFPAPNTDPQSEPVEESDPMARSKSKPATRAAKSAARRAAKKDAPAKTVRQCACACGEETTSYFRPGHDARLHGWIKKLADGRMEPKDIPGKVAKALDLVQTEKGFRAKNPHFYKHEEKAS